MELRKTTSEARTSLSEVLTIAVGAEACSLKELVPRTMLEIRDLDCCTTVSEVEIALRRKLPNDKGSFRVSLSRVKQQQQRRAVVITDFEDAAGLLQQKRIRVGFINCSMRERSAMPVLISEQYREREGPGCYQDDLGTAAIGIPEPRNLQAVGHGTRKRYVWERHPNVDYVHVYLTLSDVIVCLSG